MAKILMESWTRAYVLANPHHENVATWMHAFPHLGGTPYESVAYQLLAKGVRLPHDTEGS